MNPHGQSTKVETQNQLRINLFKSPGPQPGFIQLKLTVDLDNLSWQAYAGAAGAGCYLNFYEGDLPRKVARAGESAARLYALSQAVKKLRWDYAEARIVSIDLEPKNINAPIARIQLGGKAWAA